MSLPPLYICACELFAHTRVCVCVSLLVLLIFGWLPHRCPFPELGPFTQTVSVSLLHVHMIG
jgi:hypothetical protein